MNYLKQNREVMKTLRRYSFKVGDKKMVAMSRTQIHTASKLPSKSAVYRTLRRLENDGQIKVQRHWGLCSAFEIK